MLTYNGEIYNFRELRAELEARGHRFRSRTRHRGRAARLRASGAPAALDALQRHVRVRDLGPRASGRCCSRATATASSRSTTRASGDAFLFGSEIKALLAHPAFAARARAARRLLEYFTFQNIFTDRTLFDGVRAAAAGPLHARCGADDAEPRPQRYWDFDFAEPDGGASDERVRRGARPPVPPGRRAPARQRRAGRRLSAAAAWTPARSPRSRPRSCRTSHLHGRLRPDARRRASSSASTSAPRPSRCRTCSRPSTTRWCSRPATWSACCRALVWHLEEPRVGQSYPNYYVAQLASKFVKVVLSGAGGDELFGGYPWRYYRAVVNDDFDHYVDKYYGFWQRLVPNAIVRAVVRARVWREVARRLRRATSSATCSATTPSRSTRPRTTSTTRSTSRPRRSCTACCVVEDKLSMAHGLETRVPFLDNDLVDFAMRVPVRLKLGNLGEVVRLNENEPGPKTERYFEQHARRQAAAAPGDGSATCPSEVTDGAKQGFSAPDASWFRGESIDYVRRTLLDRRRARSTSTSTATPCARWSTTTSRAARTAGC